MNLNNIGKKLILLYIYIYTILIYTKYYFPVVYMHQIQKIFSYARILHPLKANLPTLSLSPGINIQIAPKYTAFFSTKQPELQIIKNENVKGLIHPTEETKIPYCNYYNLSSPKPKPVLLKYKLAKLKYSRWKLNDHAKLVLYIYIYIVDKTITYLGCRIRAVKVKNERSKNGN